MPSHSFQQQDDRLVVGITGHIGAGKTSVGRYLESRYGFSYIRYSQVLSEWKAQRPESRARLQLVGWEVMAGGMQQELNDRLIARITTQSDWVVDGLRHTLDFENLSEVFSSRFKLLCVTSAESTRWDRLKSRYPTADSFHDADAHPVEQHIDDLCARASAHLNNDGSLEELFGMVDAVIGKIRTGGLS
jgi:dephospho-CoA kinase